MSESQHFGSLTRVLSLHISLENVYFRQVVADLASPLARLETDLKPSVSVTADIGRQRFIVSEFIPSPLVIHIVERLNKFGFSENRSGMWTSMPGKYTRRYEEIQDLPTLLRVRALGYPENAALLGWEAVYDDGVTNDGARRSECAGKSPSFNEE